MSDRDYYEILGLTPTADGAMVDQAYWHLARKYQGLAATNPRAQHLLDELNEAYGVLGTPRLREQYDAFRDDVLIRKGMVKPVKARPHAAQRRAEEGAPGERPGRDWSIPHVQHVRTYAVAGVIASLAFAGAWQGVNLGFVIAALGIGLVLSLSPAVTSRLQGMQLSMPSMPQVSMPQIQAPKIGMPNLPDFQLPDPPGREDAMDADELHSSTAATIARWRASIGLKAPIEPVAREDAAPSTTLVDIVKGEQDIETESEPLNAVLAILRGSHRGAESRG
ncbi:MAG: J domain-containing protein [Dehalococcoidia bacterium]